MSTRGERFLAAVDRFRRWPRSRATPPRLLATACLVAAVAGLLYAIHLVQEFRQHNQALTERASLLARVQANAGRGRIEEALVRVSRSVGDVATNLLANGRAGRSELLAALRELLYSNPDLVEAGIAFRPYSHDPHLRLYGLSYVVQEGGVSLRDLDVDQDYTKAGVDWYHAPLKGSPLWLEPRYGEDRQQILATYAAPIAGPPGSPEPAGVVYVRHSVSRFQQVLDGLELGENGYGLLLSGSRRFVLHPNRDYVDNELTVHTLLDRLDDPAAAQAIESALEDPSRIARFTDPATGLAARILFRPVRAADWKVGVVLVDRDTLVPPTVAHEIFTDIALVLGASLVLLAVPLSGAARGSVRGAWIVSSLLAASCVVITGFVLWLAQGQPPPRGEDSVRITNANALNDFMSEQRRRTLAQREDVPLFIPTGIHIRSLSFGSGDDARLTGYVWQRYTKGIHNHVERGFVMPESASLEIGEPLVTRVGNAELVRWDFKATLDRHFDYSRYPFGREYLRIRLSDREFAGNLVLVPDLGSYKLTSPTAAPGLSGDLALAGWNVRDSFFSYRYQTYESNFGRADYAGLTDLPELFFNIGVQKQITGIFISNMLPLMVVFVLLFGVLFLATSETRGTGQLAFTLDVVLACAAFFLVAIFAHIAMRNSVAARDIFYLEHYYFVTYAMILFVTMNYVHLAKTPIALLRFRDNLVAKVAYWPLSMLAILVLTLVEFY